MSRSYTSSPPSACMACNGTALLFYNCLPYQIAYFIGLLLLYEMQICKHNIHKEHLDCVTFILRYVIIPGYKVV
jgi:hypothetical protein